MRFFSFLAFLCACTTGVPPAPPDAGPVGDGGPRCPAGSPTLVRGVVRTPNDAFPIAGAAVYVPGGDPDELPTTGECGECIDGDALLASARTAPDGTFTLSGHFGGSTTIVVDQGLFQRVARIELAPCETNDVDPDATRLPRNAGEGRVPAMTVVEGLYDDLEGVLRRLGLDGLITVLSNDDEIVRGFLGDVERLRTQDLVLVNCGNYATETADSTIFDALRAYVGEGGRLFVTDQSYRGVEGPFPTALDFAGGDVDGLSDVVEPRSEANVGSLEGESASAVDPTFRAWLEATGSLVGGRLPIAGGAGGGFAVMMAAAPEVDVYVEGEVTYLDRPMGSVAGRAVLPLMVGFASGCGRVGFSSIHTVDEEVDPFGPLPPREQILAYLLFQLGTCIDDPVLI
jgi:hypothetical protein